MLNISQVDHNLFDGKRVVIAGDIVADQFLSGSISRVSREAPVFILKHEKTDTRPGGGANAAANVASLGGTPILIGVVGNDASGDALFDSLRRANIGLETISRSSTITTTKIRVLAAQNYSPKQQVIRIDYENEADIDVTVRSSLIDDLRNASDDAHAIVISDYGYGVVDQNLFVEARRLSNDRNIPLIVDSRFRLREFSGATSATPNLEEVEKLLGSGFSDGDCVELCQQLGYESLLVTCGNEGMLVIEPDAPPRRIAAVGSTVPVDVTGAGDTVIAAYALGLAAGMNFRDAATVANHAGGIVVMKKGTATASIDELLASLADHEPNSVAQDISA
jgi:rfaE bifunctional protein kinase chain/domain